MTVPITIFFVSIFGVHSTGRSAIFWERNHREPAPPSFPASAQNNRSSSTDDAARELSHAAPPFLGALFY